MLCLGGGFLLSATDFMSDMDDSGVGCLAVTACQPQRLLDVLSSYEQDVATQAMLAKLAIDEGSVPHFTLHQGLLQYKGRIWVGSSIALQLKLMSACHNSALGGHSGFPVTYRRMKSLFAWKGMKSSVAEFVKSCPVCQQAKPDRAKSPGLLQPLPAPEGAWHTISLDFVEGLPLSGAANCILVVVDKFTKYGHFIPLKHPFSALPVAKLFIDHVYKLYGMSSVIISDWGRIFTSNLWVELFSLANVQLHMSSSYHPQSDGQTERVNQCMETFLRCYVNACPKKWLWWLPLAEYWYNTSHHSALGCAPFEVLYGHPPRHFGISSGNSCTVESLDEWLKEHKVMTELVRQHLNRVVTRMKHQADRGRTERQFEVGDLVFVKMQPYVQSSLAGRANQKLSFKFFGPYPVLKKIGYVAYKLDLPESALIHPVFHVSQLKKVVGSSVQVSSSLPPVTSALMVPERVLKHRLVNRGLRTVPQVLVKWSPASEDLATWEDRETLRQRFPGAPAWGQADSYGGEDVMTPDTEQLSEELVSESVAQS
jgi:hypothetical protein